MVQRNGAEPIPGKLAEPIEAASSRATSASKPSGDAQDGTGRASEFAELLLGAVDELRGAAQGLIEVYSDRVKLRVRRSIVSSALAAVAAVIAIVWSSAAALATVRGIRGAFTAWSGGHEWVGDLAGGLFALTLAAGAVAIFLQLSARRDLARLKAKYERIQRTPDESPAAPPRAGDGGPTTGSAGSPGDRAHHGDGAAAG